MLRYTYMKRILFCFAVTLLISANMSVVSKSQSANEKSLSAIREVLDAQRDAWNKGDIEGYMDGYDRSENTVFVSVDKVARGWQTVLDRYKKTYDTREKEGGVTFF